MQAIEAQGVKLNMTLNHSHVIFKIDNLPEQEIGNVRGDVESGKLILEPFIKCNVTDQWIDAGWILALSCTRRRFGQSEKSGHDER